MIRHKSLLLWLILFIVAAPLVSHAEDAAPSSPIYKIGKQRMLTQRIAKAYFFLQRGVRADRAGDQLLQALALFEQQHSEIKSEIDDQELYELFTFIDITLPDYAKLVSKPYSNKTGKEVLILSETMLEVCQSIADKITKKAKRQTTKLVDLSGRLHMLSQRVAKQYMARQSGLADSAAAQQLDTTVEQFTSGMQTLMESKQNTAQISSALTRVNSQWSVLQKFLHREAGNHPVTIFTATDNITQQLDEITQMYARVAP